jgi:hypothetical protein
MSERANPPLAESVASKSGRFDGRCFWVNWIAPSKSVGSVSISIPFGNIRLANEPTSWPWSKMA